VTLQLDKPILFETTGHQKQVFFLVLFLPQKDRHNIATCIGLCEGHLLDCVGVLHHDEKKGKIEAGDSLAGLCAGVALVRIVFAKQLADCGDGKVSCLTADEQSDSKVANEKPAKKMLRVEELSNRTGRRD
jgi:hypothetical protein